MEQLSTESYQSRGDDDEDEKRDQRAAERFEKEALSEGNEGAKAIHYTSARSGPSERRRRVWNDTCGGVAYVLDGCGVVWGTYLPTWGKPCVWGSGSTPHLGC